MRGQSAAVNERTIINLLAFIAQFDVMPSELVRILSAYKKDSCALSEVFFGCRLTLTHEQQEQKEQAVCRMDTCDYTYLMQLSTLIFQYAQNNKLPFNEACVETLCDIVVDQNVVRTALDRIQAVNIFLGEKVIENRVIKTFQEKHDEHCGSSDYSRFIVRGLRRHLSTHFTRHCTAHMVFFFLCQAREENVVSQPLAAIIQPLLLEMTNKPTQNRESAGILFPMYATTGARFLPSVTTTEAANENEAVAATPQKIIHFDKR